MRNTDDTFCCLLSIVYFIIFFFFSSCKNDIDIIEDWKETTIVYGLLNQADSIQYIKINKAFVGKGNALEMAQAFDSINYANELDVKIERWKNNSLAETYVLERTTTNSKEPGIFSFPNQVLYKTNTNGKPLDESSEYHLIVRNNRTGNLITASTSLIKNFKVQYPLQTSIISFYNPDLVTLRLKSTSAVNGRLFQVVIRFHYDEVNKSDTSGAVTSKFVDKVLESRESLTLSGNEIIEVPFLGDDFYKFIKAKVPVNDNVYRHPGTIDFKFSIAADDFNTFMEVNKPSTGIVQEKPYYTNINNGTGIFSSRYTIDILNRPLKRADPTIISSFSLDSLFAGQYTRHLGFCSTDVRSHFHCQ